MKIETRYALYGIRKGATTARLIGIYSLKQVAADRAHVLGLRKGWWTEPVEVEVP